MALYYEDINSTKHQIFEIQAASVNLTITSCMLIYFTQSIDVDKEVINLEKSCELETSQLAGEVPSDKPRYHFFVFKHTHEGDYLESIGKNNFNVFNSQSCCVHSITKLSLSYYDGLSLSNL